MKFILIIISDETLRASPEFEYSHIVKFLHNFISYTSVAYITMLFTSV
jgi:hypothetical protein